MAEDKVKRLQSEHIGDLFPVYAQSTPDNTVYVGNGSIRSFNGAYYEGAPGTITAFPVIASLRYRWDWVCIDVSGASPTIVNSGDDPLLKGTESSMQLDWWKSISSIPPQYIPIAAVLIKAYTTAIRTEDIVDVRCYVPNDNLYGWHVLAPGNLNNLLDSSVEGDKYLLLPGTYTITSPLVIKANTSIEGVGAYSATNTYIKLDMSGDYGIELSDGCSLKGASINGTTYDVGGIICKGADTLNIEDIAVSVLYSETRNAIRLTSVSHLTMKTCYFARSRRKNTDSGYTFYADTMSSSFVDNVRIYNAHTAGTPNTLSSVYIGGSDGNETVNSTFSNFNVYSRGDARYSVVVEYCNDCNFENFSGNNNGFTSTTSLLFYFYNVSNCKDSKFNLTTTYCSGSHNVAAFYVNACTNCIIDTHINPSTTYGVVSASTYTSYGLYAVSNSGCELNLDVIAGSAQKGVSANTGLVYGAYLATNISCKTKISIQGYDGGSGIYRSATTANNLYGVYLTGNKLLSYDVSISGKGSSSYGIYSGDEFPSIYGVYQALSLSVSEGSVFISGFDGGCGIYSILASDGAYFESSTKVNSTISGVTGYGILSEGFCRGLYVLNNSTAHLNLYGDASFGALVSTNSLGGYGLSGLAGVGFNLNLSCYFSPYSLIKQGTTSANMTGIQVSTYTSVMNCVMEDNSIQGYSTSTPGLVGIMISGNQNTIMGNSIALPVNTHATKTYSIYLNIPSGGDPSRSLFNCIVGNNCGGSLASIPSDKNIYFNLGVPHDSFVGNIPNNTD